MRLTHLIIDGLSVLPWACGGISASSSSGDTAGAGGSAVAPNAGSGGGGTASGGNVSTGGGDDVGCVENPSSTLGGASIGFVSPVRCRFTLAEAALGISVGYELVLTQDISDVSPKAQSTCVEPGPSGLYVFEQLSGSGQSYCLCDNGFCYTPASDSTTLHAGTFQGVFTWDGKNWYGISDTNNPKGAAFPTGDYTLEVSAIGTQSGLDFKVSDSLQITLVP